MTVAARRAAGRLGPCRAGGRASTLSCPLDSPVFAGEGGTPSLVVPRHGREVGRG